MQTLWALTKKEIDKYTDTKLKTNPHFAETQPSLLELIDLYWVSKYRDSSADSSGLKKAFYNIILKPIQIASKMIDLDTKDIKIIAEDGQSYYPSWFFGKDLKLWMKDKKNKFGQTFGQLLNEIVYKYPKYGHILLKKAGDTIFVVPLQNLIINPEARCFLESDFITEKHEYTPNQLREQPWDNIEEIISKYEKDGIITIYERHGKFEDSEYNYFIFPENAEDKDLLHFQNIKREDLFKELKWEDIPYRAMGRGQAEKLFEGQIAKNIDENLFRTGLRWTSKHIFQTRDDTIAKNLMVDIENGDILLAHSEINPVSVEERNLGAYRHADEKWSKNSADISFAYEPMSGERPPSGTPLGTTILQSQMAGMYYDLKREDLGLFLKNVLFDWIIPTFKNQANKVHKIMLGEFNEDELEKLKSLVFTNKYNKALIKQVRKIGAIPNFQEREILRGIIKEQISKQREVIIPKDFYSNLKYKIDILITNEQIDVASRLTTLQTALQIIGSNPTILRDKRTRKIFYKMIELSGFSPTDLEVGEEEQSLEQMVGALRAERGGSVARPPTAPTPAGMTMSRNL